MDYWETLQLEATHTLTDFTSITSEDRSSLVSLRVDNNNSSQNSLGTKYTEVQTKKIASAKDKHQIFGSYTTSSDFYN